jgi:hypothetical protein
MPKRTKPQGAKTFSTHPIDNKEKFQKMNPSPIDGKQ